MRIEEISEEHEREFLEMLATAPGHTWLTLPEMKKPWSAADFHKFAKAAAKEKMDWRPAAKKTSLTHYVLRAESGGPILALGLMRFPLDDKTENDGGNLVVEVPRELRGRGYGSYCLALMLFEALRAGLRRVLVTCSSTDGAARRMTEKNRGEFQDEVASTTRKGLKVARYWINFS